MKVPQMFYLRRQTISGKQGTVVFYTYWNYRNSLSGMIMVNSRAQAKRHITSLLTNAEFYR